MPSKKAVIRATLAAALLLLSAAATPARTEVVGLATTPDFGKLPLSFVPNAGQTDPAVRFQAQGMGGTLFFTPGEVVLSLPAPAQTRTPEAGVPDPRTLDQEHRRDAPAAVLPTQKAGKKVKLLLSEPLESLPHPLSLFLIHCVFLLNSE